MWRNFGLFRLNVKSKLLNCVLSLFCHTELDIAGHFVSVLNFYSLDDSLRFFRRHQCAKVENSLFHKENIRLYLFHDIGTVLLTGQNQLLLENRIESVSVDPWNAWLSDYFINDSVGLIWGISIFNIKGQLLLEQLLTLSTVCDFDHCASVRWYWAGCWINQPLTNSKSWLLFSSFTTLFSLLFDLFGSVFLSSSFFRICVGGCCHIVSSLQFWFSFLFDIF